MARGFGAPRRGVRSAAKLAPNSFDDNNSTRHLGGPHSRAMTDLFVIPTDHNTL